MRKSGLIAIVALAGCVAQPPALIQGDPTATATLFALPDAQFFAQTQLAAKIAAACPTLAFNQPFNEALIAKRYDGPSARLVRTANSRAVDLELDVATRSLQARYDVDLSDANLCAVGTGEIARMSALSALLIPAT